MKVAKTILMPDKRIEGEKHKQKGKVKETPEVE